MISDEARFKMGWRKGMIFTKYSVRCCICNNLFYTVPSSSKQKTCSLKCSSLNRKTGYLNKCTICHKEIYSKKSREKVFCSNKCKITNLAEVRKKKYENKRIFGQWKNSKTQKQWFLVNFGYCQICNYSKEPGILEIHHKDRNRTNNTIDNLQLLCPNCHSEEHYKKKDGQFKNNLGIKYESVKR